MSELRFTTEDAIRQAYAHKKSLVRTGWVLGLTSFVGAGFLFWRFEWIILPIILVLFGLLMIVVKFSYKKAANRFRKYAPLILEENITSIKEIAIKTRDSFNDVKNTLELFKNIDALRGIEFDWGDGSASNTSAPQILVNCPRCGAAGQAGQCEYCNSVI
ncbi:MAG: hypothetical protein FWE04_02680 [Oscillospiraceae bacterium]|nr:hypothetical protein [Oscillospiraceae bacterium]